MWTMRVIFQINRTRCLAMSRISGKAGAAAQLMLQRVLLLLQLSEDRSRRLLIPHNSFSAAAA